tara:strand:- start:1543 stop:2856 length:1314 start_codon:yes stop_codon:yes gene_type:complete
MLSEINQEFNDQIHHTYNTKECKEQINNIINQKDFEYESSFITDLTGLKTYTIDNKNSYELDDAISIEETSSFTRIWVHIANPSFFIELNSPIDKLARKRSSSIYLTDNYIGMLPNRLIESKFSLLQNKKRVTISIYIQIDDKGSIVDSNFCTGLISNNLQLTYEDADEILEICPKEEKELCLLYNLLNLRRKDRIRKCPFLIDEEKAYFNYENGKYIHSILRKTPSRLLIEELMILAGSVISDFAFNNNIPLPFRSQDPSFVPDIGNINCSITRNYLLKKSLNRTYISTKPSEHFTLGLNNYLQFTSPLRRYIDLLSHHQINNFLQKKELTPSHIISELITEYNRNYNQNVDYTRNRETIIKSNFLLEEQFKSTICIFLQWIRAENNYALVHFIDYSLDLSIYLETKDRLELGDQISVSKMENFDKSNKIIKMLVN